jgi:hypothetical protein
MSQGQQPGKTWYRSICFVGAQDTSAPFPVKQRLPRRRRELAEPAEWSTGVRAGFPPEILDVSRADP